MASRRPVERPTPSSSAVTIGAGLGATGLVAAALVARRLPLWVRAAAGVAGAALGALAAVRLLAPPPEGPDGIPRVERKVTLAQLNVRNLFDTVDDPRKQDDVPSPQAAATHQAKLALQIRDTLGAPTILTLQEVENQAALDELLAHPVLAGLGYRGLVLEGSDPRGIDVAIAWRSGVLELESAEQHQGTFVVPSGRRTALFTRPPLEAVFRVRATNDDGDEDDERLSVIVNHFTSKLREESEPRRAAQGAFVGELAERLHGEQPTRGLVVTGDLNAEPHEAPVQAILSRPGGEQRGLHDALAGVAELERYSYVYRGRPALLDHIFLSTAANDALQGTAIVHANTRATAAMRDDPSVPDGASDHDPLLATFGYSGEGA